MAKKNDTIRKHSSPGLYYNEIDETISQKSVGITTLGVAGEALRGPAFQSIPINTWSEYTKYFGGTSVEHYRGSNYPKYEMPYIAKSYLEQSQQLEVVRVLGLSGVNAGPAWVITATKHETYDGYFYNQISSEPSVTWTEDNTLNSVDLVPKPGSVIESSADYLRAKSDFNWVLNGTVDPTGVSWTSLDVEGGNSFTTLAKAQSLNPAALTNEGGYIRVVNAYTYSSSTYDSGKSYTRFCTTPGTTTANTPDYVSYYTVTVTSADSGTASKSYGSISEFNDECDEYGLSLDASTFNMSYTCADDASDVYKYVGNSSDPYVISVSYVSGSDTVTKYYTITVTPTYYEKAPSTFYYYLSTASYNYYQKLYGYGIQLETEDNCDGYNNMAVAVIRSRGEHKRSAFVRTPTAADIANGICEDIYEYDGIEYYASSIRLVPSKSLVLGSNCNPGYSAITGDFTVDSSNYGTFTIEVTTVNGNVKYYSVSLNKADKNYIYNVIGGDPENGDAEIYVEELYDVALGQLIEAGSLNAINQEVVTYPCVYIVPGNKDVEDLLTISEKSLTKRYNGKRYLYSASESDGIMVRYKLGNDTNWYEGAGLNGMIYTVTSVTNTNGSKEYFYGAKLDSVVWTYNTFTGDTTQYTWTEVTSMPTAAKDSATYVKYTDTTAQTVTYHIKGITSASTTQNGDDLLTAFSFASDVDSTGKFSNCVRVLADSMYYINYNGDVYPVTLDFNNYREQYRYASTPWVVSEVKGSAENVELNKLFRFHTISDGNYASTEIKISIENIDPTAGTFDVIVRDFYDSDYNPSVLQAFYNCTMSQSSSNYIANKIGTLDGTYESKSRYIAVEVIESGVTELSVPAGFLGYPVRDYSGLGINEVDANSQPVQPYFKFNTSIDEDVKVKKQYFGTSDLVGIDTDVLSYKGVEAYNGLPNSLTPCFHLDARILNGTPDTNGVITVDGVGQVVTVDGIGGYRWVTVDKNLTTDDGIEPRIGSDSVMDGTIYENKAYRKFTVCFCGGFDGWDWFRTTRSNSDEFRYNTYKGAISSTGYGKMFDLVKNPEEYGFDNGEKIITSDYYAFLSAYKQFENSKAITVNVLATPGIDYVNQTTLVEEVADMIENDRGDAIYVVTTPDKPAGASDRVSDMYTASEAVDNLDETDIDSSYMCSYYPWEQYYDADLDKYIYLPITRDVVKSIAYTDNVAYSWFAFSGWNRGIVSGEHPRKRLKIGEQDTLYNGRLNFINSFAKDGDRIWGDKNMQVADSQLNRISKRRLLLRIRTLLNKACIGLLFDPNDPSMATTLEKTVKNVLQDVKSKRGITDFKVSVDSSAERLDNLELAVTYAIKPTPLLEYIYFTAVLTKQGIEF